MYKYISLLRGINVSGQKKIKMDDLRSLYESLGFTNVVKYIQSGNVLFDSPETDRIKLKNILEKGIEAQYKFHVPVEIRTIHEIESIIDNNPFGNIDMEKEGSRIAVTFLSSIPLDNKIKEVTEYVFPPEELYVIGSEIYLYCPNGFGKTKLTNTFLEVKLEVKATSRNWKTINKLYSIAKEK